MSTQWTTRSAGRPTPDFRIVAIFAIVLTYLALVEFARSRFYAAAKPAGSTATIHDKRLSRRIRRRAAPFISHEIAHFR